MTVMRRFPTKDAKYDRILLNLRWLQLNMMKYMGKALLPEKFNVDRKFVVEWVQKKDMINALSSRKFGTKR